MREDAPVRVFVSRQKHNLGTMHVAHQPLEVELLPSQTVADLKRAITVPLGIGVECQRLFARSCPLADWRSVGDCGVVAGRLEVMLIPSLSHRATGGVAPVPARRGFNMVPGSQPWKPTKNTTLRSDDLLRFFGEDPPPDEERFGSPSPPPYELVAIRDMAPAEAAALVGAAGGR